MFGYHLISFRMLAKSVLKTISNLNMQVGVSLGFVIHESANPHVGKLIALL